MNKFLQKHFPNQYEYTGRGNFTIKRKCPDFVDKDSMSIIELFGEPWHELEEEQERIDFFSKYGYDTLIIWYKELEDEELLIKKIEDFHNKLN